MRRLTRVAAGLLAVAMVATACGPSADRAPVMRSRTDSYTFRVQADPTPPAAREDVKYTVVVIDRESGQPVENGEGQLFAENRQGKKTWDGLAPAPEAGTYQATVSFLTAGEWAIAIRFRRDSTAALERIDWMQDVQPERDPIIP